MEYRPTRVEGLDYRGLNDNPLKTRDSWTKPAEFIRPRSAGNPAVSRRYSLVFRLERLDPLLLFTQGFSLPGFMLGRPFPHFLGILD